MSAVRVPYSVGGSAGFRYGDVPREIEAALARWLADERVPEGIEVKPGRVWRLDAWAIKLAKPRGAVDRWLRASAAVRAAELHAAVLPIRSPAPLVALERRAGRRLVSSLLVIEWIDGAELRLAWRDDPAARAAFAPFMADMHARGVLHGDLNVRNVLWNGREWILLDLDGVRRGLHRLRARKLIEAQWARLAAALGEGVRACFDEYVRCAAGRIDGERAWPRIERRARRIAAGYARRSRERATGS
jgi:hypothetical protein